MLIRSAKALVDPIAQHDPQSAEIRKKHQMICHVDIVRQGAGSSVARHGLHTKFGNKHLMICHVDIVREGAGSSVARHDLQTELGKKHQMISYADTVGEVAGQSQHAT